MGYRNWKYFYVNAIKKIKKLDYHINTLPGNNAINFCSMKQNHNFFSGKFAISLNNNHNIIKITLKINHNSIKTIKIKVNHFRKYNFTCSFNKFCIWKISWNIKIQYKIYISDIPTIKKKKNITM